MIIYEIICFDDFEKHFIYKIQIYLSKEKETLIIFINIEYYNNQ